MLEGRAYYAVDTVFPLTASFIDRRIGIGGRCELTPMNAQYSDIVFKVLVDRRDESWVNGELMMLRSENEELRRTVERVFALHCPFGFVCSEVRPFRSSSGRFGEV